MKYGIGLDCGIASVGYCVMELDFNDEPRRIVKLGSRIFDTAEVPKTGASLAAPRREARGMRRRVRRHQHRLDRIKRMLVEKNIISQAELETLYNGQLSDVYELRVKALDEPVGNCEFARILIHLAQRRGFKSNKRNDGKDKEAGKLLKATESNEALLEQKGYRTVGEMFLKDEKFAEHKRNKGEDYSNTVLRSMIEAEIKAIFEAQRSFGMTFASEEIEAIYTDIALSQRPFDLGPAKGPENSPSPYHDMLGENLVGQCTFYPEEKRAAKATYSFQLFNLLQKINHIYLLTDFGDKYSLSDEERLAIKNLCFRKKAVNYADIRKSLGISYDYKFNCISYSEKEVEKIKQKLENQDQQALIDEIEKKAKFEYLNNYHQMKKALGDVFNALSEDDLDALGRIFTVFTDKDRIKEELELTDIPKTLHEIIYNNMPYFKGYGHISVKACKELIPFLEKGMTYDKACEAAGIDFRAHSNTEKHELLPPAEDALADIPNPVVKRAVTQTRKVINAIIREMGNSPADINIELARELPKSKKERDEIDQHNNENRAANERIKNEITENFGIVNPTGLDIVKLKLYHEQNGICPYTQKTFDYDRLLEPGYVDVDHIIPYSKCFDDSYSNKILTFSSENRQKSNRIPMEYIPESKKSDYQVWVTNNIRNPRKKQNLLKAKLTPEDTEGFKSRNLNDTQYLSRVLYNYINDNLLFDDYKNKKKKVRAVKGAVTAYMRKRWGIAKVREDGDLHHAADAAVIACVTEGMIQKIRNYSNSQEMDNYAVNTNTGEVIDKLPMPYRDFRNELQKRLESENLDELKLYLSKLPNYSKEALDDVKLCFVSRAPKHKATGAAHMGTLRSYSGDGYSVSKKKLCDLKLDKNGEIEGCDFWKNDDKLLYNALREVLTKFRDNKETIPKNFEFHKPKSDGSDGPIVRSVKCREKVSQYVPLNTENDLAQKTGAGNGSMIRIDVFYVENDGYYFVPIYVADTKKKELPNLACVANGKPWKPMDDKDFVFSLYPNDLIKVEAKKNMVFSVAQKGSSLQPKIERNNILLYYSNAGISTASITVKTHDAAYEIGNLGVKTLKSIEKYTVDPLGNVHKVGKEKRMRFN